MLEPLEIVKVHSRKIWIDADFSGAKHVMVQHEDEEPFVYCSFFYSYAHTSNAQIRAEAESVALSIGAVEPVEYRFRAPDYS